MQHRTFHGFIIPSLRFMAHFIALPIASVVVQSLFRQRDQVMAVGDNCGPLKCETVIIAYQDATAALRHTALRGKFLALKTCTHRNHRA